MILVDVFVPSVDKTYDFQLNEEIPIQAVIEEIAEMVSQKERTKIVGSVHALELCDRHTSRTLAKNVTLRDYGIGTGSSLILL